jgi:hypothetical protein
LVELSFTVNPNLRWSPALRSTFSVTPCPCAQASTAQSPTPSSGQILRGAVRRPPTVGSKAAGATLAVGVLVFRLSAASRIGGNSTVVVPSAPTTSAAGLGLGEASSGTIAGASVGSGW